MNKQYDDIIHLPHHVSVTRPQMPIMDRAAQFSPFAALTGYDAQVKETARLTDERVDLGEEALNTLNAKFRLLKARIDEGNEVAITFFKPDEKKTGGAYITFMGVVKKVDDFARQIVLRDGIKIPMDDVLDVDGEMFSAMQLDF